MPNISMRFPGGKAKALTFSYDDNVEQDARLKKLELTPRAIELHERIERSVRQVEERISHCLTPEEKETFIQLCEKIRADLSQ